METTVKTDGNEIAAERTSYECRRGSAPLSGGKGLIAKNPAVQLKMGWKQLCRGKAFEEGRAI
jgi:hypothetical protein